MSTLSHMLKAGIFSTTLLLAGTGFAKETSVTANTLADWSFQGTGFKALDTTNNQILLSEEPGSKGVMLVSPSGYGNNVTLQYKVKPLSPESVLVAALAVSNKGTESSMTFPDQYDGNMKYLITEADNYFFAFHNSAHKKTPFVRKYPQALPGKDALTSAPENLMTTEWHDIEVGKLNGKIWLSVNGKQVLSYQDDDMLGKGHIAFRLRGTKTRIASALIKDVTIIEN